jgi:SWI/SNF-related matrix-associated actin-dependent regulator of chromatin subfamily A3
LPSIVCSSNSWLIDIFKLCNIPVRLTDGSSSASKNIAVDLYGSSRLSSRLSSESASFEISCPKSGQILCELESAAKVQTQLYCHSKLGSSEEQGPRRDGRRRGRLSRSWFLNIIIFGPEELEDKIGAYFSKRKMYLQDPVGCECRVPYRNPHIIPDSEDTIMTDTFDNALGDLMIERLQAGPDLLSQLMEDDVVLPGTEAPNVVKTPLFRYVLLKKQFT